MRGLYRLGILLQKVALVGVVVVCLDVWVLSSSVYFRYKALQSGWNFHYHWEDSHYKQLICIPKLTLSPRVSLCHVLHVTKLCLLLAGTCRVALSSGILINVAVKSRGVGFVFTNTELPLAWTWSHSAESVWWVCSHLPIAGQHELRACIKGGSLMASIRASLSSCMVL